MEPSSEARNCASPASDCSTCSCSARSMILRMEKSKTAVQMVSTSTKESSSLEKTLPVTVRLQWRNRGRSSVPYLTSLGHLEAVARPTHCLQVTRALRVALDLLTDTPHIDIDRARRHEAGISPHRIQQMIAAEDAPR